MYVCLYMHVGIYIHGNWLLNICLILLIIISDCHYSISYNFPYFLDGESEVQ